MTKVIEYASVSPAVLDSIVSALGVFCTWSEVDEDRFEFTVCSYGHGAPYPMAKIQEYLNSFKYTLAYCGNNYIFILLGGKRLY